MVLTGFQARRSNLTLGKLGAIAKKRQADFGDFSAKLLQRSNAVAVLNLRAASVPERTH